MTSHQPAVTTFAAELRASGIREIFDRAAGRRDIVHLEIGEPDFPTPMHAIEAAFEAAREGSGYTPTAGIPQLREAAAWRLEQTQGCSYEPEQVLITQGAVQGIAVVVAAMIAPGDEVLIPNPAWPNYEMAVIAHGGKAIPYLLHPEAGFLPDPEEIASLITARTRLVIVNSPGNPSGNVIPSSDLEAILEITRKAGVVVLSDEVYADMLFDGRPYQTAMRYDSEWVIGVWSCSKSYAMTGWRVGYLAASPPLVRTFTMVQEAMIACVSSVTQAAALAVLSGPQDCVREMRDAYERRRDLVVDQLRRVGIDPVVPGGAFYVMLPLAPEANSRRAALALLDHGVAVAPGSAFGSAGAGHLRLALARSEEILARAVVRIADWYEKTGGGASLV